MSDRATGYRVGMMRTLMTARGVLEPLVAGHAGEMFGVLGDPAIDEYENEPPASEAWLARRYAALEQRGPGDGADGSAGELWLNWVVRLGDGSAAGFVQATVTGGDSGGGGGGGGGEAYVAFVLNSAYWGRGWGARRRRRCWRSCATGTGCARRWRC